MTYLKEFFLTNAHTNNNNNNSEDQVSGSGTKHHARTASGDTNFSIQSGSESIWEDQNLLKLSQAELIDMIREKNERVSILEFDLRKSREEVEKYKIRVEALEHNLASSATRDLTSSKETVLAADLSPLKSGGTPSEQSRSAMKKSIKSYEKRVLNYLVYEYLKDNNYKLTKVSFSDEVDDQDLDDWKDTQVTGLEPLPLVELYRKIKVPVESAVAAKPKESEKATHIPVVVVTSSKKEKEEARTTAIPPIIIPNQAKADPPPINFNQPLTPVKSFNVSFYIIEKLEKIDS